ncbi:MAG: polyprenol monophosphomannose synthase [Elusimicrobia bacterium]|nr:polyprenol monophosphomannose synthase [Elusimicrobiota bacterium]
MLVWVLVPTYKEGENLPAFLAALYTLRLPALHLLIVDDDSPDGTRQILEELKEKYPLLHTLIRTGRRGRGLAGVEGYRHCLKGGAEIVIEMDGDLSHHPRHIPALLAALKDADVAIGSRQIPGGWESGRPLWRRILTRAANAYARRVLGLPILDTNSGYRALRRRALEAIDPKSLKSKGPSIIHEVLFKAHRKGLRLCEVPIFFEDRRTGQSKLSLPRLAAGYLWILKLRWEAFRGKI